MKVWFDDRTGRWTASIGIAYAEKQPRADKKFSFRLGNSLFHYRCWKKRRTFNFFEGLEPTIYANQHSIILLLPKARNETRGYQPIPVRKGDKVNFRPKNYSGPSSSFRIVSVDNYGTDGIIVQSWDKRNEYFAKISDVTLEKRSHLY